jgi:predicted dehydrogenase
MRAEQITDFGTHRFDVVHQIMGSDRPVSGSATSGRYELQDAVEMPDTMEAIYEYRTFLLHYEMSNINSHGMGGRTPGMKYDHGVRASLLTVSPRHFIPKATSIAMKTGEKLGGMPRRKQQIQRPRTDCYGVRRPSRGTCSPDSL